MNDLSLCMMCDTWYGPDDANQHDHPEPQSGPARDAWLLSGLPYDQWVAETIEGANWHDPDRLYVAHSGRAPKKVCVRIDEQDVWYEPDSSVNALLKMLAEEKKRAAVLQEGLERIATQPKAGGLKRTARETLAKARR